MLARVPARPTYEWPTRHIARIVLWHFRLVTDTRFRHIAAYLSLPAARKYMPVSVGTDDRLRNGCCYYSRQRMPS